MKAYTGTLLAFFFGSAMVWAQATATITGTVTDSSSAAIVGANVTMTHLATGTSYSAVTNTSGSYRNNQLPVGAYQLTVEAAGFKKDVRNGITLEVDDNILVNFTLQVGAVTETLEISATASAVDTESATLGNVIESTRIMELPINSRSGLSLVELTPNVRTQALSQSGFADRGSAVSSFSINGGLTNSNMIVVDGLINIGTRYGDTNVNLTSDALQEFKVESGAVSPQYDYLLGGVVNFVTKSGTNDIHGVLYEFLRNNDLDARNFFSSTIPAYQYNQYGGSIGGPIKKNKLFYFGNYEQWEFNNTYNVIGTTPPVAWRTGNLSTLESASCQQIPIYDPLSTRANPSGSGFIRTQFPGNIIPPSRLDPVIQNVLNLPGSYPLPNVTPSNACTQANNYNANLGTKSSNRQEVVKLDYTISNKDTLSGRYLLTVNFTDNGAQGTSYLPNPIFRDRHDIYNQRSSEINETHVFTPNVINQFLVGVIHNGEPFGLPSLGAGYPQKIGLPAAWPSTSFPYFVPSNADGIQGWPAGFAGFSGHYSQTTEEIKDSVSWIKGNHSFMFGFEELFDYLGPNKCDYCSGDTTFNSLATENPQSPSGTGEGFASMLLGAAAGSTIQVNEGASYINHTTAFYANDIWKVTRRLTLNLGLRWDYQQEPGERHNGISNFNPYVVDPVNGLLGEQQYAGPAPGFGRSPITPDYRDWGPRIGLAYDVLGDGKTVIRAGFGIYYQFVMNFADSFGGLGYKTNTSTYAAPGGNSLLPAFYVQNGYPTPPTLPLGNALGPAAFLGSAVTYDQPWGRTPYSEQYSFDIQHQFPWGVLVDIGYVGNEGVHLRAGSFNLNQLTPQQYQTLGNSLENSVPNPYAGLVPGSLGASTISLAQALAAFPYYSSITVQNSHQASSNYQSGILSIQKRVSGGFTFLTAYTKGKSISDGPTDTGGTGATGFTALAYQDGLYNLAAERALTSIDTAERLAISVLYELPFGTGKHFLNSSNPLVSRLVSGWRLNSVLAFESGLPLQISGANNNLANRPNSTGVSAKLSDPTIYEWFNTQAFVNPAPWTFGNVAAQLPNVRAPGNSNIDFSATKETRITERFGLQLRGEAFNVANHPNFLPPNTTFVPGPNGYNDSSTFGTITSARSPRVIQVGARLTF